MEVWVVGDVRFMYEVFNGIAMITATNDWLAVIRIGALLGVLFIALRAFLKQALELQHMMIAFIIFCGLFIPKTTVILIDAYNPATIRAVDNVPLGVGFTASFLSKFGKGLTELNEQAFQPIDPSMSAYKGVISEGYLDPLEKMLVLREAIYLPVDSDLDFNLANYYADCTSRLIQSNELTLQDILKAPDVWAASRAPSPIFTTVQRNSGTVNEVTCRDADTALSSQFSTSSHQATLAAAVAIVLRSKDASTVIPDITGFMQSLLGAGVDAYRYMFNAIQLQYLVKGTDLATARSGDITYAYIVQSARERRDLNHSLEKTLFEDIMRPIMTFFEAFIYAVSPLMAFLLVIGPLAISFATRYLLMAVWVQLWLPVFAIIKLFTYLSLSGQMDSIISAGVDVASIDGAWHFQQTLSRWIGISGWLTAATPTITLALVYGGAVTANSIASRMTSVASQSAAQAANTLSPGLLTAGPSGVSVGDMSVQPQATGLGPEMVYGQQSITSPAGGSINATSAFAAHQQRALSSAQSATLSAGNTMMTQWANSRDGQHAIQAATARAETHRGNDVTAFDSVFQANQQANSDLKFGLNREQAGQLAMQAEASIGGSLPGFNFGAKLADMISARKLEMEGQGTAVSTGAMEQYANRMQQAYEHSKELRISQGDTNTFTQAQRWAQTSNDQTAREAAERYEKGFRLTADLGAGFNSEAQLRSPELGQSRLLEFARSHDQRFAGVSSGEEMKTKLAEYLQQDPEGAINFMKEAGAATQSRPLQNFADLASSIYEPQREAFALNRSPQEFLPTHLNPSAAFNESQGPSAPPVSTLSDGVRRDANAGLENEKVQSRKYDNLPGVEGVRQYGLDPARKAQKMEEIRGQAAGAQSSIIQNTMDWAPYNSSYNSGQAAADVQNALGSLFPGQAETSKRAYDVMTGQQHGLTIQATAKTMAMNPENGQLDTRGLRYGNTDQMLQLNQKNGVENAFGAQNADLIKENSAEIYGLTQAVYRGDQSAVGKLQDKFTEMAGSEAGGRAAFEDYKHQFGDLFEKQKAGSRLLAYEANAHNGTVNAEGIKSGGPASLVQQAVSASRDTGYMLSDRLLDDMERRAAVANEMVPGLDLDVQPYRDARNGLTSETVVKAAELSVDQGGLGKGPGVTGKNAAQQIDRDGDKFLGVVMGGELAGEGAQGFFAHANRIVGTPGAGPASVVDGKPTLGATQIFDNGTGLLPKDSPLRETQQHPASTAEFQPKPENVEGQRTRGMLLQGLPETSNGSRVTLGDDFSARMYATKVDSLVTNAANQVGSKSPDPGAVTAPGSTPDMDRKLTNMVDSKSDGVKFRSELLGLEAQRAEGYSVDGKERELFSRTFGSHGASMYQAFQDQRVPLQEDFERTTAQRTLKAMEEQDLVHPKSGLIPTLPMSKFNDIHTPKAGVNFLQDAADGKDGAKASRPAEELVGSYVGSLEKVQAAVTTELGKRAAQH